MHNTSTTIQLIFAGLLSLHLAACGGTESTAAEDEASIIATPAACRTAIGRAEATPTGSGSVEAPGAGSVESGSIEPKEPVPTGGGECSSPGMGYCCNTGTGNVSKTQQSGCTGNWYTDLAGCLTDTVCGSPSSQCYIN